jgi:hypothetical protein
MHRRGAGCAKQRRRCEERWEGYWEMLAKDDSIGTQRLADERYVFWGFALSFALAGGLWVYILFWL